MFIKLGNVVTAKFLDDLFVACDDERVAKVVKEFGGKVILTAREHSSGTERLTEVVNPLDVKVVVNIQGDEPLIHPSTIDSLVRELLDNKDLIVATIIKKIEKPEEINDQNVVKVVFDKDNFALYFSRSPIPFVRDHVQEYITYYKHIGLYGYTKDFLFTYKNLTPTRLEKLEKLEQLRILEHGYKIKVIETKHETFGVDVPEDLEKIRQYI